METSLSIFLPRNRHEVVIYRGNIMAKFGYKQMISSCFTQNLPSQFIPHSRLLPVLPNSQRECLSKGHNFWLALYVQP